MSVLLKEADALTRREVLAKLKIIKRSVRIEPYVLEARDEGEL